MADRWSRSTGEGQEHEVIFNQARYHQALTVLQANVGVAGSAKDLAATISSGKSAQNEREAKRKAREEKEKAAKEQEWKERQDMEREKDKGKA